MRTKIVAIMMLASLGNAAAKAAPPDIAFSKGGPKGDAIYVVDQDGTGLTKIYQSLATSRFGLPIDTIAVRSRSGGESEVAFVENYRTVKVQRLDSNRQPIGGPSTITVSGEPECARNDLDYLSDGTLLIATCTRIWAVAADTSSADETPVIAASNINALTAIGTSILYVDGNLLKLKQSSGTSTLRQLAVPYLLLDAGETTAFASDRTAFQTIGLNNPYPDNPGCTAGGLVEVSPDGTQILYLYRGWMLVQAADCSGSPFRVGKGPRAMAWRTY